MAGVVSIQCSKYIVQPQYEVVEYVVAHATHGIEAIVGQAPIGSGCEERC